jgi:hypothetical protein
VSGEYQKGAVITVGGTTLQSVTGILRTADNALRWVNATKEAGKVDLNLDQRDFTFVSVIGPDYTVAARAALGAGVDPDNPTVPPTQYLTDVNQVRAHTSGGNYDQGFDVFQVSFHNGIPLKSPDGTRWNTVFGDQSAAIIPANAPRDPITGAPVSTTLYRATGLGTNQQQVSYLGDSMKVSVDNTSLPGVRTVTNTFGDGTVVSNSLSFVDSSGNPLTSASVPADGSLTALDVVKGGFFIDRVSANSFVHGPITTMAPMDSSLGLIQGGVTTDAEATSLLSNGVAPVMLPTGVLANPF